MNKDLQICLYYVGCEIITASLTHQENYPVVVINRAQFGVGRPGSF